MKQKLNSIKIVLSISVILTLMFSSCQKDDNIHTHYNSQENNYSGFIKSQIDFKEFQERLGKYETFRRFEGKFQRDLLKNGEDDFILYMNTDRIVVFSNDSLTTYTLSVITSDYDYLSFTNIIFEERGNNLNTHLVKYTPSESWRTELLEGNKNPFEGDIFILNDLGEILATIENFPVNTKDFSIGSCSVSFEYENTPCCGNTSCCPCTDGNGIDTVVGVIISCISGGDSGGGNQNGGGNTGGGNGGGNTGGGSGNTVFPTDPMEPQGFMMLAYYIEELGGEVDWSYQVILDPEFVQNDCLYGVYEEIGKAPIFNDYLKNFNDNMSVANLRFGYNENFYVDYGDEYSDAMAITIPPQNYLIKIVFNGDPLLGDSNIYGHPKLVIALAFIHEIIHAEIHRKMMSVANLPHVNFNSLSQDQWESLMINLMNDFPGIWDYYLRYMVNNPNPTSFHHEQMASHYRDIVSAVLAQYDNNQQAQNIYQALAWIGLKGTTAWNILSQQEQNSINTTISNYYQNATNVCD